MVERIRGYVREWNRGGNLEDFELSLSIGVAPWSDGKTLDEVLDLADRDMYAAKAASKRIIKSIYSGDGRKPDSLNLGYCLNGSIILTSATAVFGSSAAATARY